ncbi:hypothetical protein OG930_41845 [Streptomyces sp. NBC_01799]|nr:hypothetical protein OG930_41845 [Streptomyces sp. NBC_01799]
MAARKALRAWGGTATRGRSEAQAPGRGVTGSGRKNTAAASNRNTAMSRTKTSIVGAGAYCTSSPAPSAPTASPAAGATLLRSGPRCDVGDGCLVLTDVLFALSDPSRLDIVRRLTEGPLEVAACRAVGPSAGRSPSPPCPTI